MFCTSCGAAYQAGAFCASCGSPHQAGQPPLRGSAGFGEQAFLDNWSDRVPEEGAEFHRETTGFLDFICANALTAKDRLTLAQAPGTSPLFLAHLAFDKAHVNRSGDIRIAVASNPSTPASTLSMLFENADRVDWLDYDSWLDYENDDWSAEVDSIGEYNSDVKDDIVEAVTLAVSKNPSFRQ